MIRKNLEKRRNVFSPFSTEAGIQAVSMVTMLKRWLSCTQKLAQVINYNFTHFLSDLFIPDQIERECTSIDIYI